MEYIGIWLPLLIIGGVALIVLSIIFGSKAIRNSNRRKRIERAASCGLISFIMHKDYSTRHTEDMNCDTELANGHIYFYNNYFDWFPNNPKEAISWRCYYKDIDNINREDGIKKKVTIRGKGDKVYLFLYKANTLVDILEEHIYTIRGK